MNKVIQFSITQEDSVYTASGINAPIVTDGATFEDLQKNIKEAVSLYLEEMQTSDVKEFINTPAIIANFDLTLQDYA